MLKYDSQREVERRIELALKSAAPAKSVRVGMIGAGGYASGVLLPLFKAAGVEFQSIASATGISAREVGARFGFHACVSGAEEVIGDDQANLIVVATRHGSHACLARRALERGRHVFVEKPLATNDEQLDAVIDAA